VTSAIAQHPFWLLSKGLCGNFTEQDPDRKLRSSVTGPIEIEYGVEILSMLSVLGASWLR
jgi:hypothetical protein